MERGLGIHTERQVLLVVRRGVVMRALHTSTGAPGHGTPHGRFQVVRKERRSWSVPFRRVLPYALYFHRGFAVHQFHIVPRWAASHGCVRLPSSEAPWVYSWAQLGTPVNVVA